MSEVVSIIDTIFFGYSSWPADPIVKYVKKGGRVLACHLRRGWGKLCSRRMTRVRQQLLVRHAFVLDLPSG